jgi:urease accessory protein
VRALHVLAILGDADEPRFAGRARDSVRVGSADASKRRQRLTTAAGTDVAVDLPRGGYLRDGAVLADDGERIVVVERSEEEALVVSLSPGLPTEALIEAAVRVGHAFGNQHAPVDVEGGRIRIPITTSPELAAQTVASLGLAGVEAGIEKVRLGLSRPLTGPAHHHGQDG